MVAQHLVLHLVPDGVKPKIYLSQNDYGLEKLNFDLVDANTYYEIPSDSSVIFLGMKNDKKMFSYACTYSGHTVTCDVTEQMTSTPGYVVCELRILGTNGEVLGSINIDLIIERSPIDSGVCSHNDFRSPDDEIISIHQESYAAKGYSEQAAASAEEARVAGEESVAAIQASSQRAQDEMWRSVDSVHDYIVNGFTIDYFDDSDTMQIIN